MDPSLNNPAVRYRFVDRLLHRLAFSLIDMQLDLSAREDRDNSARLDSIAAGPPVFVTALPRAGTTLLLDVLSSAPEFAAHSYRDMPFLFCPLTWQQFSSRFRREAAATERAHGDGLSVHLDSVEAFEEAFWLHFWPDHYADDYILSWSDTETNAAFEEFFAKHMRKSVLKAQSQGKPNARRYLSKNNANIARTGWIKTQDPQAIFLVPFRHPAAHIKSLLRQHQNFRVLHHRDRFSSRYMADLGHFEFGRLHRPIRLEPQSSRSTLRSDDPDYWAEVWISAYQHLLDRPPGELYFVDFDALCLQPASHLPGLARMAGLESDAAVLGLASRFRPPVRVDWAELGIREQGQRRATELYEALQSASKSSFDRRPARR